MDKELMEIQKEIVMLLAILVRRSTLQTTVMQEMDRVGFPPKRIAELLGTTANTVSVTLSKNRKKKGK